MFRAEYGNVLGSCIVWQHYGYDQRNLMLVHTLSYNEANPQLQAAYIYDGTGNQVRQTDLTGETPVTTTTINDVAGGWFKNVSSSEKETRNILVE